jgi:hypothetical protein
MSGDRSPGPAATTKPVDGLAYGDLFELADLPVYAELDEATRQEGRFAYARVQTESYREGRWLWLDTSFGYFRLDPNLEVVVYGNEPHPFGSRSKR